MTLWVDKFRPKSFNQLDFHKNISENLSKLVEMDDFPHLLLYGPPGSGKITLLNCILNGLYGVTEPNNKIVTMSFDAPSGKKVYLDVLTSPYHIQVNPSDVGIYDRVVIQDLIKQTAQTFQVNPAIKRKFKLIIIVESHLLTKDAQNALRRTMEKYASSCRIVLISLSLSSIIDPIQSRCVCIRIPLPSRDELKHTMNRVANCMGITADAKLIDSIYDQTHGNVRRSLLIFESCRPEVKSDGEKQIYLPQWEQFLKSISESIVSSPTPQRLLEIREKLYELLSHCIPSDLIITHILFGLLPLCNHELKCKAIHLAAEYQKRLVMGSTPIIHLEAFIAHFMSAYMKLNPS